MSEDTAVKVLVEGLQHLVLIECWKDINKSAAKGVDGVSAKTYALNLEGNVHLVVEQLKAKRYRAQHVRRHNIPKEGDKVRPLGIPVVEDKLLQLGVAKILEAIYEQDFLPCSYGYRPGVSAHAAVDSIQATLQFGSYNRVVEADIKGYFDNIDHDWLMKMLALRIDDKPFLLLIRKWLKAGVLELSGHVVDPEKGSPQGGVISPILANIYLHYALDLWFEKVVKKHCQKNANLWRYADDWVCAFEREEDAQWFFDVVAERLKKFKLELSPEKTHSIAFSRALGSGPSFEFLGFEFRWGWARNGKPHLKRRTSPKKFGKSVKAFTDWCRKSRNMPIRLLLKKLGQKLQGYYNYYGVVGNSDELSRYGYVTRGILHKWLNRRSQSRSYNWHGFHELLKDFHYPTPKTRRRAALS